MTKSKEEKQSYNKEYYQLHKEEILAKQKGYYGRTKDRRTPEQKAKDCERAKIYYQKNKDKILKKNAFYKDQWYQNNKERILQEKKEWRKKMLGTIEYRFKRAIQTAKQRGIPFLLTLEQFSEAANHPCYYCNFKLCSQVKEGSGLDRIDSNKGYEIGNIISCGHRCNMIKNDDLTMEETKAAVEAILKLRTN